MWKAPLPDSILSKCDFTFGHPGSDNRFAFELRQAGLRVTNPCFKIVANHLLSRKFGTMSKGATRARVGTRM